MTTGYERVNENTLRLERLLPGPIERVWAYLTEADKRAVWFCGGEWDLRPGGKTILHFNNMALTDPGDKAPAQFANYDTEVVHEGKVKAIDAPNSIVLLWVEDDGTESEVTFELTEAGDQVRLVLTHTDITGLDNLRGIAGGWQAHLDIWQAIESGRPRPSFWSTFSAYHAEASAAISA